MMLSGAWALWRLCVSDFYQGKPIRPDRGMMILGHHHSGDTAPTNPTTPSSIRQPKTPSHAPAFPCSPSLSSSLILPLHSFLFFVFFSRFTLPTISFLCRLSLAFMVFPSNSYFHSFRSTYNIPSLYLSFLSLMANTKTNSALFLAHETFNISFQILADESKK